MKKQINFNLLMLHNRTLKCILISLLIHLFLIIFLCILFLPKSSSEEKLIDITFSTGQTPEKDFDKGTEEQNNTKEDKEIDPLLNTDSNKLFDEEEIPDLDEEGLEDYLKERAKKIQEKKRRLAQLSKYQSKINKSLAKRGKYGLLKPRTFYGVYIFAKAMVFVLDISGSMDIYEAKLQIKNAYHSLTKKEYFNIIAYSDQVLCWKDFIVPATKKNKLEADLWVDRLVSGGGTNIYLALKKAFEVAWRENRADTIYLLSDGLPTTGEIVSPFQILKEVKKWNRNKKIIINTIGIGYSQDKIFLSKLAEENYGRYYRR